MADEFTFDVFLSHSAKDKAVVRPIAERLRRDGLKVWFDEWVLKPGDPIQKRIDDGLEDSRVLVLCMSANAFGSDWAKLEAGTFRFRDPLNKERRFIPLRLDDAPIKGPLTQFLYVNWLPQDQEGEYVRLLEACRPHAKDVQTELQVLDEAAGRRVIQLDLQRSVLAYAFSPDGRHVLTGCSDESMRLWEIETGNLIYIFKGDTHNPFKETTYPITKVQWSSDGQRVLSRSSGGVVRVWDVRRGCWLLELKEASGAALSEDGQYILTQRAAVAQFDVWSIDRKCRIDTVAASSRHVSSFPENGAFTWSPSRRYIVAQDWKGSLFLFETARGAESLALIGHTLTVKALAWSSDERRILSASDDRTVRLWDTEKGHCLRVLEGHTDSIAAVAWSPNQRHILSGSSDNTLRLWDVETGRCLRVLEGHRYHVIAAAWSLDGRTAFSGDCDGGIQEWDLSEWAVAPRRVKAKRRDDSSIHGQVQYTNAKVLLVGESGVGKTGLSLRLAKNSWCPTDSTIGAWATQWKLPVASDANMDREVWLWDFGGQADQRLIHQLYMDETALAVLVFDGQKEDLFETLGQWDRDLARASRRDFAKLLVAGRVDTGGLRVSRSDVRQFAKERRFLGFIETSAKHNLGCEELKRAILDGINWNELPSRTTQVLFRRLKDEIIRLKDDGRNLLRFNELREILRLQVPRELKHFTDDELHAVLTLLTGPGVVWELNFGSWVLLQPERINAYAQALIRTLQADEYQRGCLLEEQVLNGDLAYESSMARLEGEQERFVLLAMHQTLVERGLCLRQPSDKGNLLVFPSYFRRERLEQASFPAVLVCYRFTGFLDEIYATLVVRLHHTGPFKHHRLWRYAADFETRLGKKLGIKLTRREPGVGELELYFDSDVALEDKIIFSKYVHEHLLQHAQCVERLRQYLCPHCATPVGNREVAMRRLNAWLQRQSPEVDAPAWSTPDKPLVEMPSIVCSECENRVPLWDEIERRLASPETRRQVHDMQEVSAIVLDNESKERALVGEVISTVALAGQVSREFHVSDHGIDMEIEFKNDQYEATGKKLYLQLKSGDSYLRKRRRDGSEVFAIRKARHATYWRAQAFPVMLVTRTSEGEVRWMEIRDYLRNASDNGKKAVKQILFKGERFDVMSVRRWRDVVLGRLS